MNRIRERRKALDMTLKQLASVVGVSEGAISHYETGRREPDPDMLGRIANALNVSVDYILGRDERVASSFKQPTEKAPSDESVERGIDLFRQLSEENKAQVMQYMEFLRQKQ